MDWEPLVGDKDTNQQRPLLHQRKPQTSTQKPKNDSDVWLRPQRFFPHEQPTGLENLLMRTRLIDDEFAPQHPNNVEESSAIGFEPQRSSVWSLQWTYIYILSVLPLLVILAYLLWNIRSLQCCLAILCLHYTLGAHRTSAKINGFNDMKPYTLYELSEHGS